MKETQRYSSAHPLVHRKQEVLRADAAYFLCQHVNKYTLKKYVFDL